MSLNTDKLLDNEFQCLFTFKKNMFQKSIKKKLKFIFELLRLVIFAQNIHLNNENFYKKQNDSAMHK